MHIYNSIHYTHIYIELYWPISKSIVKFWYRFSYMDFKNAIFKFPHWIGFVFIEPVSIFSGNHFATIISVHIGMPFFSLCTNHQYKLFKIQVGTFNEQDLVPNRLQNGEKERSPITYYPLLPPSNLSEVIVFLWNWLASHLEQHHLKLNSLGKIWW